MTYYSVRVIGSDGRKETKLNTPVKARASKEARRLKLLGWSGEIVTEKTGKVIASW